jgi:hypothetical protein
MIERYEHPGGARWMFDNWKSLFEFNFQWIAATSQGLASHHESLQRVFIEVLERGLADQAVYAFVSFDLEQSESAS